MIWTSGSMIFIQYRHKQCVRCIHRISVLHLHSGLPTLFLSLRPLPFHFTQSHTSFRSMLVFLILLVDYWWTPLLYSSALIPMCFPVLIPFIVISHDSTVSRTCFAWVRSTEYSRVNCIVCFCTVSFFLYPSLLEGSLWKFKVVPNGYCDFFTWLNAWPQGHCRRERESSSHSSAMYPADHSLEKCFLV